MYGKLRFIAYVPEFILMILAVTAGTSQAQEYHHSEEAVIENLGKTEFSPYVGRTYPPRPLWGDQHLHTQISVDAGTLCRLSQEDAYRFARGEEVTSTTGVRAKLSRPLDWLVISDHKVGKRWYEMLNSGDKETMFATVMEIIGALSKPDPPFESDNAVRNAWQAYIALADRYNEPGRFSAIIGNEYTTRGGFNLHRNVLYRGDASMANQMLPYSQFDSQNPEDLWKALDEFEKRTGADVLAIPHNGNLSNGLMFSVETNDGKLPPVGNTVDVANATWTNTIGAAELIAVWKDPEFDPNQHALYYARVLEIPTPRWTAYEAKRYGIEMPDNVPMVIQERAYTSPIWYTPDPSLVTKRDFYPGLQDRVP